MVNSMERWIGKVAVVTGASSGIGAAIAEKLVDEGLLVVGLARRIDKMEEAARKWSPKRGSFHPIKCDVSIESDILAAFDNIRKNLGPTHILINNAGIAKIASLTDGDTETWRQILDVNLLGLCICTREAIKDFNEHTIDGHIIHMSSVTGLKDMASSHFPLNLYPATKSAINTLSTTLRREFNNMKSGIKITTLIPGIVLTELFDATGLSYDALKEGVGGNLPFMDSEDIADAVVYVLSTPPNVMVTELTIRPVGEPL